MQPNGSKLFPTAPVSLAAKSGHHRGKLGTRSEEKLITRRPYTLVIRRVDNSLDERGSAAPSRRKNQRENRGRNLELR